MSPAVSSRPVSPARTSNGTRPSSPALSSAPSAVSSNGNGTQASRRMRRPSTATASSVGSSTINQHSNIPPPSLNGSSRANDYGSVRGRPSQLTQGSRAGSPATSTIELSSSPSSYPYSNATQSVLSSVSSPSSSFLSQAPTEYTRTRSGSQKFVEDPPGRVPSPALSTASKRSQQRPTAPIPEPPLPKVTKLGGTLNGSGDLPSQPGKRDGNARISFYDSNNQALLDRLLFATAPTSPSKAEGDDDREGGTNAEDWEDEGDTALSTLQNIEEMLDGYEWIGDGLMTRSRKDPADAIEQRLLDELTLLEKVGVEVHLFPMLTLFLGQQLFAIGV